MPLRMDSSWLAVRCSSLTEAAPSKAPSSISDTLLLLRLLGEEVAGEDEGAKHPLPPSFTQPLLRGSAPHPESPFSTPGQVLTATFPPVGNSHFLQMGEFFKHTGGLQDGDLIVV